MDVGALAVLDHNPIDDPAVIEGVGERQVGDLPAGYKAGGVLDLDARLIGDRLELVPLAVVTFLGWWGSYGRCGRQHNQHGQPQQNCSPD